MVNHTDAEQWHQTDLQGSNEPGPGAKSLLTIPPSIVGLLLRLCRLPLLHYARLQRLNLYLQPYFHVFGVEELSSIICTKD